MLRLTGNSRIEQAGRNKHVDVEGLTTGVQRRALFARALLDAPPRTASDSLASPAEPAVSVPTPARCPHCGLGQLIVMQVLRAERKLPP